MRRVLLAGATGMIGRELGLALVRRGVELHVLSRDPRAAERLPFPARVFPWAGNGHPAPKEAVAGVDAVVNLTGESIAEGRWTAEKKRRLRVSRLGPARALTSAILTTTDQRPPVYVQASATGFYGDTGEVPADESSPPGRDVLAQLCVDWEEAARPLIDHGLRVVHLRFGVVLALTGGALPQLAALHRIGLGAVPGSGHQWLSWIHIDDAVQLILTALGDERYAGPINAVTSKPCRFLDLSRELTGRRGALTVHAPVPLVRLALGEMAQTVLGSSRVLPTRLAQLGYRWQFNDVGAALDNLLGTGVVRTAAWQVSAQWVPAPLAEVSRFFADEKNLEALTPPWMTFHVVEKSTPEICEGTRLRYRLRLHGVPLRWESLITRWRPDTGFVDEQVLGPYSLWRHQHAFEPLAGGTLVTDRVRYKMPLGRLGALAGGWMVERDVRKIFEYRRKQILRRFPRNARAEMARGGGGTAAGAPQAAAQAEPV